MDEIKMICQFVSDISDATDENELDFVIAFFCVGTHWTKKKYLFIYLFVNSTFTNMQDL